MPLNDADRMEHPVKKPDRRYKKTPIIAAEKTFMIRFC
jgi:hypothetical protein